MWQSPVHCRGGGEPPRDGKEEAGAEGKAPSASERQELCWLEMMGIWWSKQWTVRITLHHLWNRGYCLDRTMLATEKIQQRHMVPRRFSIQQALTAPVPSAPSPTLSPPHYYPEEAWFNLPWSGLWKGDAKIACFCDVCVLKMRLEKSLFFFSVFTYLFIWLLQVLVGACRVFTWGMQTLSCSMWGLVP